MKNRLPVYLTALLWLLAFCLPENAAAQRHFPYKFRLDSRSLDTLSTPSATSPNHRYRITAWGTYSMWEDTVNSSVDPVWIYSFPEEEWAKPEWRIFPDGYPIYVGDERMLDAHGLRINNKPFPKSELDTQNHRYTTIIRGDGRPITASIVDWNFKGLVKQDAHDNNSGILYVLVEELPITEIELCGVDSSRFPVIRASVKVRRDSLPVENLAGQLGIQESGTPVVIDSVDCSERVAPVSVAMVFDRSGSMADPFGSYDRIHYTRGAGKIFIEKLDPIDEAAVYSFSLTTRLDQTWTSDRDALKQAIDRLQPDGWTAMNDAVLQAIIDVERRPANHRKAIVVLSDGEDNRSLVRDISTVIARAKSAGVPVFAVGLLLDTEDSLRLLAAETGGSYYSVRDPGSMDSVFAGIADRILEQGCCSVYYTSPDRRTNGTFRPVQVSAVFPDDTTVSAADGYHAPGTSSVRGEERRESGSSITAVLPNPMHDPARILFRLEHPGPVAVDLLDERGQVVRNIYRGRLSAGDHEQVVAVSGLPSGRYFMRMACEGVTSLHAVTVVR